MCIRDSIFKLIFRIFLRISSINVVIFDLDRSRESPGVVFRLSVSSFFAQNAIHVEVLAYFAATESLLRVESIVFYNWFEKPIAFSQRILRIGFNNIHFGTNRADQPRCSKFLFFLRILNKNRWFSDPDRSRPLAPTGSGAQNRCFLKGF